MMIKPYYEHNGITLYCGDCRDILPQLDKVDLVLTDPPYPDYHATEYKYFDGILDPLKERSCKQLIFWSAKEFFPLDYTAIHIWDKLIDCGSYYERIFERNGNKNWKIYREHPPFYTYAKTSDLNLGHPSQKPIKLITELVGEHSKLNLATIPDTILDPFCGSGTTLVAAKQLGRKAIGIEISEKYVQIAIKRLGQEYLL